MPIAARLLLPIKVSSRIQWVAQTHQSTWIKHTFESCDWDQAVTRCKFSISKKVRAHVKGWHTGAIKTLSNWMAASTMANIHQIETDSRLQASRYIMMHPGASSEDLNQQVECRALDEMMQIDATLIRLCRIRQSLPWQKNLLGKQLVYIHPGVETDPSYKHIHFFGSIF